MAPSILRSLDDVEQTGPTDWEALCPICGALLRVSLAAPYWHVTCSETCTAEEIADWVGASLWAGDPAADRIYVAIMLAKTPETAAALLRGKPVLDSALDQTYLNLFRSIGAV